MICPKCQQEVPSANRFCEECGTRMKPEAGATAQPRTSTQAAPAGATADDRCPCGAGPDQVDSDGFCSVCGLQRQLGQDRREFVCTSGAAGISDVGKKHHKNDDYFCVSVIPGGYVAVLCDGVSNSQHADEASRLGAETVLAGLTSRVGATPEDWALVVTEAIAEANRRVCALPRVAANVAGALVDPPSCTVVAAVVAGRDLVVGWMGDSRAYWVTAAGIRQLTQDDTDVKEEMVPALHGGQVRRRVTRTLSKCLGETEDQARVTTLALDAAGLVLLCTDGLWNYAADDQAMRALLQRAPAGNDAFQLAHHLVGFALDKGGRDNITAVCLLVPAPDGPGSR